VSVATLVPLLLLLLLPLPCRCRSWANKQRRDLASGLLPEPKAELLHELGFEADEQEAEWLRWFLDLARCVS
jgi:hypothetical protein